MHDEQRPRGERPEDDIDDEFDDALDDLFGPDDEPTGIQPSSSGQTPQRAGGNTPPEHVYVPDHDAHQFDDAHVIGPENAPPPPSYASQREPTAPPETATPPSTSGTVAPEPPVPHPPLTSTTPPATGTRDWRKITCFGCLFVVGLVALFLAVLVLWGFSTGVEEDEPTAIGRFVDSLTPAATEPDTRELSVAANSESLPEPYETIRTGREPVSVAIDGEDSYGSLNRPVPIGSPGPVGNGWEMQIDAVIENANQAIVDANMLNEPPVEGRQYVIGAISATNTTAVPGVFDANFRLRLVGAASGSVYTIFEVADRCGVTPEPFAEDEIAPGATASGNVCWQVRTEDVSGLVLYNKSLSETDTEIWFALTGQGALADNLP